VWGVWVDPSFRIVWPKKGGPTLNQATDVKNKRRSERVMLRVPVVLSVTAADGKVWREEAFTQVVNAHGGLLVTQTNMIVEQRFVLTNPRTGAARECSVVRSESGPLGWSIAFQFEVPAPNFWPIAFPPQDWHAPEPLRRSLLG
jgi:hypothetical protein